MELTTAFLFVPQVVLAVLMAQGAPRLFLKKSQGLAWLLTMSTALCLSQGLVQFYGHQEEVFFWWWRLLTTTSLGLVVVTLFISDAEIALILRVLSTAFLAAGAALLANESMTNIAAALAFGLMLMLAIGGYVKLLSNESVISGRHYLWMWPSVPLVGMVGLIVFVLGEGSGIEIKLGLGLLFGIALAAYAKVDLRAPQDLADEGVLKESVVLIEVLMLLGLGLIFIALHQSPASLSFVLIVLTAKLATNDMRKEAGVVVFFQVFVLAGLSLMNVAFINVAILLAALLFQLLAVIANLQTFEEDPFIWAYWLNTVLLGLTALLSGMPTAGLAVILALACIFALGLEIKQFIEPQERRWNELPVDIVTVLASTVLLSGLKVFLELDVLASAGLRVTALITQLFPLGLILLRVGEQTNWKIVLRAILTAILTLAIIVWLVAVMTATVLAVIPQ